MTPTSPEKLARFYQLIDTARPPQRADRSVGGLLPTRAFRFCEAVTTASAFGGISSADEFQPDLDRQQVTWTFDGTDDWVTVGRAQFPGFLDSFDDAAPDTTRGFASPFLAALPEPGVVLVWSGLLARTAPDRSLLLHTPTNLPRSGYDLFEGIVERDRWFGPLFTSMRLTRTDIPVTFDVDYSLFQGQPLHRSRYTDGILNDFNVQSGLAKLQPEDWAAYGKTAVYLSNATTRQLGYDAAEVRRRRRRCANSSV